jgi:hypothetical protein
MPTPPRQDLWSGAEVDTETSAKLHGSVAGEFFGHVTLIASRAPDPSRADVRSSPLLESSLVATRRFLPPLVCTSGQGGVAPH